jgi:DNA-binding response OmpR family regulator
MNSILLLEDDTVLSKEISLFLTKHGFQCDCVYDGSWVSSQFRLNQYDIAILDINVPGLNGLQVCRELRATDRSISIIMLTAFGEVEDKVNAFNAGADDYLVKPFHFDELLVRIHALLRRKEVPQINHAIVQVGDLIIDTDTMQVFRGEEEISLSPKEFKLLNILAAANGRVVSKDQIAEQLWDYHIETNHKTIEVYINFLRKKIDVHHESKLIHTKVGFGYFLKEM